MSGYDVSVNCVSCGQMLVLSAQDLRAAFTCPRCGNTMPATQLVRLSMPVRAVPAGGGGMLAPGSVVSLGAGSTGATSSSGAIAIDDRQPHDPLVDAKPRGATTRLVAERLARWLGDRAWWLDSVSYGHRLLVLSIVGAVVLASRHLSILAEVYLPALFGYCTLLYLLLLARLWWVREEGGRWTWRSFIERSFGATQDAVGSFFRAEELSLQYVLERLQLVLVASGLGLAVVAPPLGALARWLSSAEAVTRLFDALELGGQVLFVVGLLPWLLKKLRGRSAAAKAFQQAAAALTQRESLSKFPLVVDLRQDSSALADVPLEFHPLLGTLARWKPRANDREAGYERSLVRFLERSIPGVNLQTQLPFEADDGSRGRIDLVLDDVVAIELKRDLRASAEADRAVGQVLKYAASWRKGPILLLLVEASAEVAELPVLKRIAELREDGRALFVVAAGRWRV